MILPESDVLMRIIQEVGTSFYLLNSHAFIDNFNELRNAFRSIYPNTQLAYSYKTNYIPALCKIVDDLGGFAEVVSDMEYMVAKEVGVAPKHVVFNGPCKDVGAVSDILLTGGIVNLDSIYELPFLERLSIEYPSHELKIGIRCNLDIHDGVVSRFGVDVESSEFREILNRLSELANVHIVMLHFHFATRSLESWKRRIEALWRFLDNEPSFFPQMIDLGGGLFGKMPDSLKAQFATQVPSYQEYSDVVAYAFLERFGKNGPVLLLEPGTALVGDVMTFVCPIASIKNIRGKWIATLKGSVYNINPTLNGKNPPIQVIHSGQSQPKYFKQIDFGGYTCIESDYLYKGFAGECAVGDYVLFGNAGSYSIVLKPPFILPNFPVVDYDPSNGSFRVVKRAETFDDIFHTYIFS